MENYIGEIRIFAGTFAPAGWYFCNGALLSIADNEALFQLIGTTYGGDGQRTFALPDFRSRVVTGFGTGPGLANRQLGETFGTERVTLTTSQMGSHTHTLVATAGAATTANPSNARFAQPADGALMYLDSNYIRDPRKPALTVTDVQVAASTVDPNAGGGQSHENLMPTLAINYIIAAEGFYPSQQ